MWRSIAHGLVGRMRQLACAALVAAAAPAAAVRAQSTFPSGVSAGDVTDRSAVCWTRTSEPSELRFELAIDPDFTTIVETQLISSSTESGGTARVLLDNLTPSTSHAYRFVAAIDGATSPVGRFRTAPPPDQVVPFTFVFSGDSDARAAPFRVLEFARRDDPAFWIWFGDTIYGDVPAGGLGVATDLASYRDKYRQNLGDPYMQTLLQTSPVWVGWDDHEVVNDYDGGDPERDLTRERIDQAYQAFFEHLPIRPQEVPGDPFRIYRSFRYGALAEFFLIDGRQYRSADAARVSGIGAIALDPFGYFLPTLDPGFIAVTRDASRTMLGMQQRAWLRDAVTASTARFKFLINPVPLTSLLVYPEDRWDGYDAERYALLRAFDLDGVEGLVVLTTDSHANVVNPDVTRYLRTQLRRIFGRGFEVPEFVVGPIGTATVGGVVRRAAQTVLLSQFNPLASIQAELLFLYAELRVAALNGLSFIEPDRYAYLRVEVEPDGVTLTHRGIRTDDPTASDAVDLHTTTLSDSGRVSRGAPPCFLLPFAMLGAAWCGLRVARGSPRVPRTACPPVILECGTGSKLPVAPRSGCGAGFQPVIRTGWKPVSQPSRIPAPGRHRSFTP